VNFQILVAKIPKYDFSENTDPNLKKKQDTIDKIKKIKIFLKEYIRIIRIIRLSPIDI